MQAKFVNAEQFAEFVSGLIEQIGGQIDLMGHKSKANTKKDTKPCNCSMCGSKVKVDIKESGTKDVCGDVKILRGLTYDFHKTDKSKFITKEFPIIYNDIVEKAKKEAKDGEYGLFYVYTGNPDFFDTFIERMNILGYECEKHSTSKEPEYMAVTILWA